MSAKSQVEPKSIDQQAWVILSELARDHIPAVTYVQLGEAVGVDGTQVGRYVNGLRVPTLAQTRRAAAYFDFKLWQIIQLAELRIEKREAEDRLNHCASSPRPAIVAGKENAARRELPGG